MLMKQNVNNDVTKDSPIRYSAVPRLFRAGGSTDIFSLISGRGGGEQR